MEYLVALSKRIVSSPSENATAIPMTPAECLSVGLSSNDGKAASTPTMARDRAAGNRTRTDTELSDEGIESPFPAASDGRPEFEQDSMRVLLLKRENDSLRKEIAELRRATRKEIDSLRKENADVRRDHAVLKGRVAVEQTREKSGAMSVVWQILSCSIDRRGRAERE